MTLARFTVPAFVNWGDWKVRCPRCPNADLARVSQPFACETCGLVCDIEWPSEEMRYGIGRLLLMRPDPSKQNWLPGETLTDLMAENAAHNIFDFPEGYDMASTALVVDDERIRVDTLPSTRRRELAA
jgi:hypothetical protein